MWSGPKENDVPGGDPALAGSVGEGEVVLDQLAGDHCDRAGGDVVVVPAGVVLGGPAEQPDVDVVVAVERDVDPLLGVEGDVVRPLLGVGGDVVRPAPPARRGRGRGRSVTPARSVQVSSRTAMRVLLLVRCPAAGRGW